MIPKGKIIFRELDEAGIEEALAFYNTVQGEDKTAEQWNWEYRGFYPDLYEYGIAEDNGGIIGVQGMIPVIIDIKGDQVLSCKSEDSLVDPEYRGGNVFTGLYDYLLGKLSKKHVCCIWGFTAANRVWRDKLGFTVHEGCMGYSIRVVNLFGTLRSFRAKPWSAGKKLFMSCMAFGSYIYGLVFDLYRIFRSSSRNRFVITRDLKSVGDLGDLYIRARETNPDLIFIPHDRKYLQWRLDNNPGMEYEARYVYKNDVLKAYCYTGISKKDSNILVLTDIMAEDSDAGRVLLDEVMTVCRAEKIGMVFFLGNRKNPMIASLFGLIESFGFVTMTYPISFVFKDLDDCNAAAGDVSNWYATALWTEGFTL